MSQKMRIYANPLARARGHGSAKHGVGHWQLMFLSSIALVPLSLWLVGSLMWCVGTGDFVQATAWLQSPLNAGLLLLLLGVTALHTKAGLQTIIEDYIHAPLAKRVALLVVQFGMIAVATFGVLAVLKVFLGA